MTLGYTLFYVDDVELTMKFYTKAFGLNAGFMSEGKEYGEMETGGTKLGFVNHATAGSHGFSYDRISLKTAPPAMEVGFVTNDVEGTFSRAVEAGALPLSQPQKKPWGQVVSYVRDCNGFLVEICSPLA